MTGDPLYIAWLKIEKTERSYAASPVRPASIARERLRVNHAAIDDWFRLCDEMMDAIKDATDEIHGQSLRGLRPRGNGRIE